MRKWLLGCMALVSVGSLAHADTPPKLVEDTWDAAYLQGSRVGFFHTSVREIERDGVKILRTNLEMDLTIKRYNALARLRMENGTEEEAGDGKVRAVFMTLYQDKGQKLIYNGTVDDDVLHVVVDNGRIDKRIPWAKDVLGLERQQRLFQDRKVKPGDHFRYHSFEPTFNTVVTVNVKVMEPEEVEVLGKKQSLVRVEAKTDKLEVKPGEFFQPPAIVSWLDKNLLPVRAQMSMPGMGEVVLYRTTKALAQAPVNPTAKSADLGLSTLVPLSRAIARPFDSEAAVYRITLKDDDNPETAFARDDRQEVKNVKGSTFELHVKAVREPRSVEAGKDCGDEFRKSCYYLDSDDSGVKLRARRAVGAEKDELKKARLIERWVADNLKNNNSVPFGPASQVAENLEGDCRQHALLCAAMCRAAGVPSRTAVGLVYVTDRQRGPVMGFHMWTEVWVRGQWLAIDATLGQGSIGAAHIKISDSSWHDVQSLTPLIPVARVLGKLSIEVVSVNGRK
jgi:hypothetical protein